MRNSVKWLAIGVFLTFLIPACGDSNGAAKTGDLGGTGPTRVQSYLRGDQFTRLVFEVDSVDGYAPMSAAEQGMIGKIKPLVDKPAGVEAVHDGTIVSRGADHAWTLDELDKLAAQSNTLDVGDNTIKMHVMFVDGHSDQDTDQSQVLGLAWGNENIAIFKKTIQDHCQGVLTGDQLCKYAEQSIWTHEVGHVLGLVDNGAPKQSNHQDIEHGHHCNNDQCVMYWAYEGTKLMDVLKERLSGNGGGLNFDDACKADLKAVRDGE